MRKNTLHFANSYAGARNAAGPVGFRCISFSARWFPCNVDRFWVRSVASPRSHYRRPRYTRFGKLPQRGSPPVAAAGWHRIRRRLDARDRASGRAESFCGEGTPISVHYRHERGRHRRRASRGTVAARTNRIRCRPIGGASLHRARRRKITSPGYWYHCDPGKSLPSLRVAAILCAHHSFVVSRRPSPSEQ